jgi:hypothetical protein
MNSLFTSKIAAFALLLLGSFLLTSCGVPSPPLPPERPGRINATQLTAMQRGSQIILKWTTPPVKRSSGKLDRIDIYRLAEQRSAGPTLTTVDTFRESACVVGFVPLNGSGADAGLSFMDPIDLATSRRLNDTRFLYSVVYINTEGRPLGFSELAVVEPITIVPDAPKSLTTNLSQEEIALTWEAPSKNIDNTAATQISGYNIYRSGGPNKATPQVLNTTSVTTTAYSDRTFQFETEYTYTVRAITSVRGNQIESLDSQPVVIKPIDTFAPAAPTSITIASANGTVSLFWPSNSEPDVVGYNVYRSDNADTPDAQWTKLNGRLIPHPPTSFTDDHVQVGKRYYYKLTAIDRFGNESKRSDAVSEEVNP